jgi:hypothetical protein
VLLTINNPRPGWDQEAHIIIDAGRIERRTYMRPAAAKYVDETIPNKWPDILTDEQFNLTVEAGIGAATLKSIGALLQNSGTTHE